MIIDKLVHYFNRFLNLVFTQYASRKNEQYEKKIRSEIKNTNFSILSPGCVGGVIYHRLTGKFLSPTINLWFYTKDFCKFCLDLDYYLSCDLVEVQSNQKYPIGMLGDITIHFNHYSSFKEARNKWDERKKRINYKNIYIIMPLYAEEDKKYVKRLIDSEKYKIVVWSNFHWDYRNVKYIKPSRIGLDKKVYLNKDWLGFRKFEKMYDYVSFLNH